MTRQQVEELREAFELFDKDGDGSITSEELLTVMTSLRQQATEAEIKDMIQQVDIDGKGQVSFEDFVELMMCLRTQQSVNDEMRSAFQIFDQDGDGFIDAMDIGRTMADLGEKLTAGDVEQMIHEADADGDGKINFEQFIRMMYAK
ncbi:hypothetical protein CAPTEDRAFT_227531 [Capitella teleta]|uniref:EF-hand domain-containing protein n=1 Tax=Capitella teleta TaxID=283909 RepID=R7UIZ5_CAPTE|nr:hypothetical protein CAPTEDRAFT_227531 [Capitella teleta]|eukprot:ELU06160.1 hypothetical protein CAPTEDRAFT_227531 [Capitella teleta]